MNRPTFSRVSRILFTIFAALALASVPEPAFAQRGGGGHGGGGGSHSGGGGGGFHGGGSGGGSYHGGGSSGVSRGGGSYSNGGRSYGSAPSARSYGPSNGSYANRGGSSARPSGNSAYAGGRNGSSNSMTNSGRSAASASGAHAPAVADGQWHSFGSAFNHAAPPASGTGNASSQARSSGNGSGPHPSGAPQHVMTAENRAPRGGATRAVGSAPVSVGRPTSPASAGSAAHAPVPSAGAHVAAPASSRSAHASPAGAPRSAAPSALSPNHALANMEGSRFSNGGLNGREFGSSAFGHSATSRSAASPRIGAPGSLFGTSRVGNALGRNTTIVGFGPRFGFGNRFCCGFGFFPGFGFGGFGGFGFGFGWGLGFGWGGPFWGPGWGGYWGPYYDPWGPYAYGSPNANYNVTYSDQQAPPPPPPDASNYQDNSGNAPVADATPNTNPVTGNVAQSTPTVLLYLKDGTMYTASDYWVTDNKLHYLVNYGGESVVDLDQVDLQRTVDENAKRNVRFALKPNSDSSAVLSNTDGAPADGTAPATQDTDQTNPNNAPPAAKPAPAPAPAPQLQSTSQTQPTQL
jgi:hypothetical protein